jgi:phytoene dehydrogenase-like protein
MTQPVVMREADVVVVGAGHNALTAAAYLACAGLEVVVLEARDVIGGNTVTEELTLPGFRHDACASAHVLIQSNPLIRDDELGLREFGLTYVYPDPAVVMRLGDGSSLVMRRDAEATAAELARRSAHDAEAYLRLLADWDGGLRQAHGRWNAGTLDPGSSKQDRSYARLRDRSAWDVVHERFRDQGVRDFLLWLSFATIQRPHRGGTGVLPFAITAGRNEFGWAMPMGGSDALPRALARLVKHRGGEVLTSRPVEAILVRDGCASGVRCAGGEVYAARRAVVSSAHLTRVASMITGCEPPPGLLAACQAWRPGLTLFAVHLALRGPLHYPVPGNSAVAAVAGGIGSASGLSAQIAAFDRGETDHADPWLLVVCPESVDPSRAPQGRATAKLLTIAPRTLSGGRSWDMERDRFAAALVDYAAARLTGLTAEEVLAVRAECPLDLEERNPHNVGGSCHGGEFMTDDGSVLVGWQQTRILAGLYQTGATAHPGGSVSGRPGRITARRVLADLGIDPSIVMGGG